MVLSQEESERHEVLGELLRLAEPETPVTRQGDWAKTYGEQMNSMNKVENCYPRAFIEERLRTVIENPIEAPKIMRQLIKEKLVFGPLFTSRMVEGKKQNLQLYHVPWDKVQAERQELDAKL